MFYSFIRWVAKCLLKIFYRFKSYGESVIPESGKVLMISNHISWTDIITMWAFTKRKCYFMAKSELFKNPLIRLVIKYFGAYPVRRGQVDRASYEKTVELLNADEIVVIFLEGSRHKDGGLTKFRNGAARFALVTGATVAPVVIKRSKCEGFIRKTKIEAILGDLVEVEHVTQDADMKDLAEETTKLTQKFFNIMTNLKDELDQKISNGE